MLYPHLPRASKFKLPVKLRPLKRRARWMAGRPFVSISVKVTKIPSASSKLTSLTTATKARRWGWDVETKASGFDVMSRTGQVLQVYVAMRLSQKKFLLATRYATHKQRLPFPGLISAHLWHERQSQMTSLVVKRSAAFRQVAVLLLWRWRTHFS